MSEYRFEFAPVARPLLLSIGVRPDNSLVRLTDTDLIVEFGPFGLSTDLDNVTKACVAGPHWAIKAIGPRLSLADRGVTFGTNARRTVCIEFDEPVKGLPLPLGMRHPNCSVSVADCEQLAEELNRRRG